MNRLKAYWPYVVVALIIMLPLLEPGYILTLDMVFVPHPPLPDQVTASYLFHVALHFLSYVIPGDILQKVILLSIFVFAGIGAHRLVECLRDDSRWLRLSAYAAGVLYVINPFVYGRFMAGQYAVLLGYALLPFFVRSLLVFLDAPSLRRAIVITAWVTAVSILSVHTLGLLAVVTLVAFIVTVRQRRRDTLLLRRILGWSAAALGMFILINSYWLVPALFGHGAIAEQSTSFTMADYQAFATDGGVFSVLQLHGFWAEAQHLFKPSDEPLPLSGVWQLLLWIVIGIGAVSMWRRQRLYAVVFMATGLLATILAIGGPINVWLTQHMPLFAGYREPHKFVGLLALVFAVFAAYGIGVILVRIRDVRKWKMYVAVSGMLLLSFLVTPTMAWGFNGQLKPVQYPSDWYVMNDQLRHVASQDKILFLPWHLYMRFNFSERIIANPADAFFGGTMIRSNNPEFAGLKSPFDPTITPLDGEILPSAHEQVHLGSRLKSVGVRYILLSRETDKVDYSYLDRQTDLSLMRETPTLKLYRNDAFGGIDHAGN